MMGVENADSQKNNDASCREHVFGIFQLSRIVGRRAWSKRTSRGVRGTRLTHHHEESGETHRGGVSSVGTDCSGGRIRRHCHLAGWSRALSLMSPEVKLMWT